MILPELERMVRGREEKQNNCACARGEREEKAGDFLKNEGSFRNKKGRRKFIPLPVLCMIDKKEKL